MIVVILESTKLVVLSDLTLKRCLKGHSHEKMYMFFFGPLPQKIIDKIIFNTFHHKTTYDKSSLTECFVAFSNRNYNLCMPQVLIVLFIRVIVTGVLVMCSNL